MSETSWTPGPWDVEHRPSRDSADSHAVVTDESGNVLFDSLNRGYKVSLVEMPDVDGLWYDSRGYVDLRLAAAAPELYAACRRYLDEGDHVRLEEQMRAAVAKAEGRS